MKILHIIDTLEIGGAEKLLATLAQQAQINQVDLTIISLYAENQNHLALAESLKNSGAKIAYFPASELFNFSRLRDITKFVKKGNFSVIHTHLTYANILGTLTAKLTRTPIVSTLHSTAIDQHHSHFLRDKIELWMLRLATKVIGVGKKVSDIYQPILGREVITLPNAVAKNSGLSAMEREKLRSCFGLGAAEPTFISVGRLSPEKGIEDLLTAFKIITQNSPNAKLLIVGDGELLENLKEQCQAIGLEDSVHWLGMRDDVPELLAASDIYISASHREGLSLSLLEAMMAVLPMAVTDVGENAQLVGNDAGILAPHNAPEQLAEAALKILAMPNYGKALGKAGLARAKAKYSAEQWFSQLLNLYEEITLIKRKQAHGHA